jgi:hypothetical protein
VGGGGGGCAGIRVSTAGDQKEFTVLLSTHSLKASVVIFENPFPVPLLVGGLQE